MNQLKDLEEKLHYQFQNPKLLQMALTHSSYANESKEHLSNNERLEFLGDAVLSIVVSDYLYQRFNVPEGDLTKLRSAIVCEKSLAKLSREIGLGDYLLLGKGEEMMGGRERSSTLCDVFEAVLGAIYLDGGMEKAREYLMPYVQEQLECHNNFKDYKTMLQEVIQQNPEEDLGYVLVEESGPDHNKTFVVEVHLNSNVIGRGTGKSKKAAEQMAAKEALALMGE